MSFDSYASEYDAHLGKGIRLSGEDKEFFARGRLAAAATYLHHSGIRPRRIVEFGCGIGTNLSLIAELWPECDVVGLDQSTQSLEVASRISSSRRIRLMTPEKYVLTVEGLADWVFCNGVFHHIPVADQDAAFRSISSMLGPGGAFTLFENNPYNPGARWVMNRIPFDRDAKMINPYRLKATMRRLEFKGLECRFFFVFPRFLSALRALEPYIERLPAGAQYGIFGLRPPQLTRGLAPTV